MDLLSSASSLRIRKAKSSDAAQVSKLIFESIETCYHYIYSDRELACWKLAYTPFAIQEMIDRDSFFCMESDDVMLGDTFNLIAFGGLDADRYALQAFYVQALQQRKGVGSRLLFYLEEVARRLKYSQLFVFSVPSAQGFYKRYGYQVLVSQKINWKGMIFDEVKLFKKL